MASPKTHYALVLLAASVADFYLGIRHGEALWKQFGHVIRQTIKRAPPDSPDMSQMIDDIAAAQETLQ